MESFNLKKMNEVEGKEQYRVPISNSFEVLENIDTEVDRLCGLVVKVSGSRYRGPASIPGATRFSE
jgi:hypothetical protein